VAKNARANIHFTESLDQKGGTKLVTLDHQNLVENQKNSNELQRALR